MLHCCGLRRKEEKKALGPDMKKAESMIKYAFLVFYALYNWHFCAPLVLTTFAYLAINHATELCSRFSAAHGKVQAGLALGSEICMVPHQHKFSTAKYVK